MQQGEHARASIRGSHRRRVNFFHQLVIAEALDLSTKEAAPSSDEEGLKTRNGIVLRPQPSDDPTDPL